MDLILNLNLEINFDLVYVIGVLYFYLT